MSRKAEATLLLGPYSIDAATRYTSGLHGCLSTILIPPRPNFPPPSLADLSPLGALPNSVPNSASQSSVVAFLFIFPPRHSCASCSLVNILKHGCVLAGTKNPALKAFCKQNTHHTNILTMMSYFPIQRHGFNGQTYHTPWRVFRRGWTRPPLKGLV